MQLKRPLIVSIIVLPTITCLWYFSLLPAAWRFINEAGLFGWGFYMVFEWLLSRESSPERLAQIGRAEVERKQELEEIDRRRRATYDAIIEWIQPPQPPWQLTGQKEEPPFLGEKPPKYASRIDDSLSRNYPQIWADLQEFRKKYAEWKALSIGEFSVQKDDEVKTVYVGAFEARKASIRSQLVAMQRGLIQQIKLEIVDKHDTELKC
jgi:hypothetical protein